MRPLLLALAILFCQAPTPPITQQLGSSYRSLVDGYRSAGSTEIEQVLAAPLATIETAVGAAVSAQSLWTWQETRGAAMMHSDVALRALSAKQISTAEAHILLAQRLLDRTVSLSPPQDDFAWRWYATMPHVLRKVGGSDLATRLWDYARVTLPRAASRQDYLRGLAPEWRAANYARVTGGASFMAPAEAQLRGEWSAAVRYFEKALEGDPSLHAASLHLGRIRMLLGERDTAAPLFRSAVASVDPNVGYLAALFLGSLEEREGRFNEAEALYRRAMARVPYGQAAPLALAELLSRTAREAEARAVLGAHLLKPDAFVLEPMWAYGPPHEDPGMQMGLLRMEVWK